MALFITLCKVIRLILWVNSFSATLQMKAFEQYFSVVSFIMLYKVIPADHVVLFTYPVQGDSFETVGEVVKCEFSIKSFEQYFSKEQCATCFVVICKMMFRIFLTVLGNARVTSANFLKSFIDDLYSSWDEHILI